MPPCGASPPRRLELARHQISSKPSASRSAHPLDQSVHAGAYSFSTRTGPASSQEEVSTFCGRRTPCIDRDVAAKAAPESTPPKMSIASRGPIPSASDRQHHAYSGLRSGRSWGGPSRRARSPGESSRRASRQSDLAARGERRATCRARKGASFPPGRPAASGWCREGPPPAQGGMAREALVKTSETKPASSACST